jgi:adenosylcobinamide-phosphate synthase
MLSILAAVLLDAAAGDPYWFPHPVRFFGKYIKGFEAGVRKTAKSSKELKVAGVFLTISTVLLAYFTTYFLLRFALNISPIIYYGLNLIFLYTCLAARCLSSEAMKIYSLLVRGDIEAARKQTSMIVGRDTDELEEQEVTRAVVETVAENCSDGVIAPLLYMAIGGAPLAMAYKAVNTLDSMVGYKNDKYINFGWCSAKLDDLVNYIPARLTGFFIAIAALLMGFDFRSSFATMLRDGRNHSSPNSGYPEAAAAGAIGIQLGGTNLYFGKPVYKPTIGTAKRPIEKQDIKRTILLMLGAYILTLTVIAIIYVVSR